MNERAGPATANARPKRRARRRAAEWVSLGISVALICLTAGYLVYDGLRSRSPVVPVDVRVELDRAVDTGGRYVLPLLVRNLGQRTLRDVRVEVSHQSDGAARQTQDFDIDYLGERAEQRIFVYLEEDPRTLSVEARAMQYRLD